MKRRTVQILIGPLLCMYNHLYYGFTLTAGRLVPDTNFCFLEFNVIFLAIY